MSEALRDIAGELTTALAPIIDAARDADALKALLADLGWTPNSLPQPLIDIAESGAELVDLLGAGESVDGQRLIAAVKRLVEAIEAIRSRPDAAFPTGVDLAEFKSTISRDLLDYLLVEYLMGRHPMVGSVLKLAGVIRLTNTPASGLRRARLRREIAWNRIGTLLTDPLSGFREAFDWTLPAPRFAEALADLSLFLEGSGLQLSYLMPGAQIVAFLNEGASPPFVEPLGVELRFDEVFGAPEGIAIGLHGYVRPPGGSRPAGIALLPFAEFNGSTKIDIAEGLALKLGGSADFEGGIAITLAPGRPPEVKADLFTGTATSPPEISVGLQLTPGPGDPERVLLGAKDASRLAASGITVAVGARLVSGTDLDVFVQLDLDKMRVAIKPAPDESDSFLATVLGEQGLSFESSFGLRLSNRTGLSFTGSGGLEASFPLHVQLGPIDLQALTLGLKPRDKGFDIESGVNVSGKLGPLTFVVESAGFKLLARFPDPPNGNLGPVDVGFGFKPPNGVGLAVDAGAVKGGGYLYFDFDKEEYAGALELSIADFLTLTAVGLITTRMPDGSKGFSLLIIITAEFGTGIQLGFGFTLVGVGGLLGLNRTMLFQPLMDGVRTGAINGILFPTDIIANAPKIISDLKAIFPPKEGTFLIGPMAKLGWGSPPLITLSLGVIIEIPPGDIAILGVLSLAIPDDDPVLILQVNFAGALEFSKQRLYFFAALFDSHILTITIDGEIAVLFAYGADANLLLSVGGFHPQFNPPPLPTPIPKRIQLDIINEQYARIRCGGYFAATTNTLQFGAFADLYFGFSAVSVTGHMTFDLLMQWSPLHLIAEITTTFSAQVFGVGVFGVDIDVSVEGPTPWHIHGHGSISFLFFSVSIPIDKTFGDAPPTSLPPIAVLPVIGAELGKQANWKAALPDGSNLLVTLRQLNPTEAAMVLHPVGTLQVSQRAVPLNLTIDKVGAQKPSDANYFKVDVTSAGLVKADDLFEPFAPAQFKDYDDAAKLSQPAYSPQHSGVALSVATGALASGTSIGRQMRYALTIVDTNYRRFSHRFYQLVNPLFVHFLGGGSVTFSSLSAASNQLLQPLGEKITAGEESYTIANQSDNHAYGVNPLTFSTREGAQDYLDRAVSGDPMLADKLHVLPQFEVTP